MRALDGTGLYITQAGRPDLDDHWGDSLLPLAEHFFGRGVLGPGGPKIISNLAKANRVEDTAMQNDHTGPAQTTHKQTQTRGNIFRTYFTGHPAAFEQSMQSVCCWFISRNIFACERNPHVCFFLQDYTNWRWMQLCWVYYCMCTEKCCLLRGHHGAMMMHWKSYYYTFI